MYIPTIIITSIVITIIAIIPVQLNVTIRTCEPLVDMNVELVEATNEENEDELIILSTKKPVNIHAYIQYNHTCKQGYMK